MMALALETSRVLDEPIKYELQLVHSMDALAKLVANCKATEVEKIDVACLEREVNLHALKVVTASQHGLDQIKQRMLESYALAES